MSSSETSKNKSRIIPPQWKRREKIELRIRYDENSTTNKEEVYKKVIKLFYWI